MFSEVKFRGVIICLQIITLIMSYMLILEPAEVSGTELTAKDVVIMIWSQQYPKDLKTEVFFGEEVATNGRDIGAWSDLNSEKAEIFIGNYKTGKGFLRRSGGTLYEANKSDFGYEVYVSRETGRRAKVKRKAGSYESPANQTQLNYFDISRSLFMEDSKNFDFSFVEDGGAIKVVPRKVTKGDYAFRLFYVGITNDGSLIISKIEYFSEDGDKIKTRISGDFRKYEIDEFAIWRPDMISVSSEHGVTEIKFTNRKFNVDFGELSKKDLKKGRPPGWHE